MQEVTDVCHGCKNFRQLDKLFICAECSRGKEDKFEPIDE